MWIPNVEPDALPTPQRYQSAESIVDDKHDKLRKWVLAAKQFAGTLEKARSRDHVVERVKKEMDKYLEIMKEVCTKLSQLLKTLAKK